ncbi:hypothetical protein Hamer_G020418 [Homarus americanus]|uniref:Uncharacterized protein n=1 Tax=Homarus americanus TaxID=6706 RepID=A0A8J5JY31_HOMAM|nr:hypothetical protein Hamer_G020418 [Homarus americanus]
MANPSTSLVVALVVVVAVLGYRNLQLRRVLPHVGDQMKKKMDLMIVMSLASSSAVAFSLNKSQSVCLAILRGGAGIVIGVAEMVMIIGTRLTDSLQMEDARSEADTKGNIRSFEKRYKEREGENKTPRG